MYMYIICPCHMYSYSPTQYAIVSTLYLHKDIQDIIVDHILTTYDSLSNEFALDKYVPYISSEPWVTKVKAKMYMYMHDLQYTSVRKVCGNLNW